MRCTDISLPHNIQCVSVDLWGTLFYDQHYIDKLNSDRIVLLRDVLEKINFNFDAPAEVLLLRERKRFQESEKNGEFLNLFNRIDFLTQHKLSVRDVFSVNKMINARSTVTNTTGEGYIDTAVKIIIAVVVGALLLGGLYYMFNEVVYQTLKLNLVVCLVIHLLIHQPHKRYNNL